MKLSTKIGQPQFLTIIVLLVFGALARADENVPSYWEYGIGVGFVHWEHYPGADQFSDITLPVPTFQYRGEIIRADDRDGARAYLLKGRSFVLELSGTGYTGLESKYNRARQDMENLPWILALGPQLVYQQDPSWTVSFGAFKALATDFRKAEFPGEILQLRFHYQFDFYMPAEAKGHFFMTFKAASRGLQQLYYETEEYKATAGLMSQEISYFQTVKMGRASFYAGFSSSDYSNSENRESPLHLRDRNLTYLVGVTYVLEESTKSAVPEEETEGIMNRYLKAL